MKESKPNNTKDEIHWKDYEEMVKLELYIEDYEDEEEYDFSYRDE